MKPPADLRVHSLASVMPDMLRDEYVALVADIKKHGLRQPIVLYEGQILDGIHRRRACIEAEVDPDYAEFEGTTEEAEAYVLSLNVHRRHLTLEQRRKLIDAELKRDPAQSDRSIARKVRVSDKTVKAARSKAEANADALSLASALLALANRSCAPPVIENGKVLNLCGGTSRWRFAELRNTHDRVRTRTSYPRKCNKRLPERSKLTERETPNHTDPAFSPVIFSGITGYLRSESPVIFGERWNGPSPAPPPAADQTQPTMHGSCG